MTHDDLIAIAKRNIRRVELSRPDLDAGTVGCALLADNGRTYEGICVHLTCGLGFCAEAAAIANMLRDGATRIRTVVAVNKRGVLSPCGRCREMMMMVDEANTGTEVLMPAGGSMRLAELIPHHWRTPQPAVKAEPAP